MLRCVPTAATFDPLFGRTVLGYNDGSLRVYNRQGDLFAQSSTSASTSTSSFSSLSGAGGVGAVSAPHSAPHHGAHSEGVSLVLAVPLLSEQSVNQQRGLSLAITLDQDAALSTTTTSTTASSSAAAAAAATGGTGGDGDSVVDTVDTVDMVVGAVPVLELHEPTERHVRPRERKSARARERETERQRDRRRRRRRRKMWTQKKTTEKHEVRNMERETRENLSLLRVCDSVFLCCVAPVCSTPTPLLISVDSCIHVCTGYDHLVLSTGGAHAVYDNNNRRRRRRRWWWWWRRRGGATCELSNHDIGEGGCGGHRGGGRHPDVSLLHLSTYYRPRLHRRWIGIRRMEPNQQQWQQQWQQWWAWWRWQQRWQQWGWQWWWQWWDGG